MNERKRWIPWLALLLGTAAYGILFLGPIAAGAWGYYRTYRSPPKVIEVIRYVDSASPTTSSKAPPTSAKTLAPQVSSAAPASSLGVTELRSP